MLQQIFPGKNAFKIMSKINTEKNQTWEPLNMKTLDFPTCWEYYISTNPKPVGPLIYF